MSSKSSSKDIKGAEYVRQNMPQIGLGTYLINDEEELRSSIDTALECGYRFVDTAQVYRNEAMVGRALKDLLPKYELGRKEIFITSKLNPKYNGAKAYEHVRKSVEALRTEYIDLFLIHWPGKSGLRVQDKRNQEARRLAWEGLEKAYDEGLVRSIGISNYQPQHMDELMEHARIQPAVNQCEFHPAFCPQDVLDSCKKHGIVFQAYSSFGGSDNVRLLDHQPFTQIAQRYKCTVSQLLLSWALSQDFSVLPKSTNPDHIRANLQALNVKMSVEDVEAMKWEEGTKFCWNPKSVV